MNEKMAGIRLQIKAMFEKDQVEQEASKAADVAQKTLDKKRTKIEVQADIKSAQKNFEKLSAEYQKLKKDGASELKLKVKADEMKAANNQIVGFRKELKALGEEADKAAGDDNQGMGKFMKNIKNTAIWGAAISFVKKLASTLIELGNNYQTVADEFDRFTGSAEVTKDLLSELSEFSSENGLDLNNVRETASSLLQLGIAAEDIVPTMQSLGDISAGTGTSLEDLTDILSDITEEGSLTKDTFNDLIKAGVPIGDQLAKDLGLTVDQVKALASEGKITDEQVSEAFQHMTEEGGAFYGSMEEQADSLQGRWNTLKTTLITMGENIASGVMPAFEGLMSDAQKTTDALMETGQTGESGMLMIQRGIFGVVTLFRGLVKVITSIGSYLGTKISAWFTKQQAIVQALGTGIMNLIKGIGSKETWSTLGDNIAYGIGLGVNKAIDALNKLTEWISQIPGVNIGKVDHVNRGSNGGIFDFSGIENAFEGADMAMKDTIDDIKDDWLSFFDDVGNGWESLGKTTEKSTRTTNATLNDLIKNATNKSKAGSKDAAKTAVEAKKKELQDKRDLMIKEVEESEASENEKRQKLLDIYNWYKNELIVLEGKTNDELLKNAKDYLEDYQKEFEKASESDQKAVEDSIKKVQKYDEQIGKLGEKREEYKEKAKKSLREVNNSIDELDKDFIDDTSDRYDDLIEKKRELMSKNSGIEDYAKRYDKDTLYGFQENGMSKLGDIDIKNILEYQDIMREISFIESTFEGQLKTKIELTEKLTETEKKYQEYLEKRNQLVEQSKIYEAYSQQEELSEKAIKLEDDKISYYDKEQDKYVEITDFKNQEIARELLNQQTKLDTENQQLETAKKEELEIINTYNNKILARWQSDTKAYRTELNNRKEAVRQYVEDVQALLASIPSSYRAYGGELNKGVTMVGENGPEAIVRRQASYVQPRNSVMNNSTVYNNQSSLSVNGIEIGNFASVEDMLNGLKPYLTRRS